MRERIDIGSDISVLLAQLRRLAASRLGRRLGVGELILVPPKLAQTIIDLDSAVQTWGREIAREEGIDHEELRELWESLKQRVIRKAAVAELRKYSENIRIFVAAQGEEGEKPWASSDEPEEEPIM